MAWISGIISAWAATMSAFVCESAVIDTGFSLRSSTDRWLYCRVSAVSEVLRVGRAQLENAQRRHLARLHAVEFTNQLADDVVVLALGGDHDAVGALDRFDHRRGPHARAEHRLAAGDHVLQEGDDFGGFGVFERNQPHVRRRSDGFLELVQHGGEGEERFVLGHHEQRAGGGVDFNAHRLGVGNGCGLLGVQTLRAVGEGVRIDAVRLQRRAMCAVRARPGGPSENLLGLAGR
jgi:hypothetical protein